MRRLLLVCALALTAGLVTPASLTPSALGAVPGPRDASARLVTCRINAAQSGRYLSVEGAMRALAPGDRLQMRFDLQRRGPGAPRFVRVGGPGLGTWSEAARGVTRFRYRRRIENLPAPAEYRVVVSFRWLAPGGAVRARATRVTPPCVQPDLRPDVRFEPAFGREPVGPERVRYTVTVVNAGRTAAADFDVVLSVGGVAQPAVTVENLAAGERRAVSVLGPRCTTGTVAVALDPDRRLDEANERNNGRAVACKP